ncbi:STM4015 family protein [Blastopirellula marina]|uniref:Cytoplasmic protein n=1 Tax=Blastopirellula marina TaxID=124 RepID=A0A2S8FDY1_9BACT|nr:STM4015 family protein [Blastopirellula marina]PQO30134.1 hypothetical protein C5Y98_21530 [Blastopirellula marina]PTL42572.1 hypothetical protein C5Y97_21540 [Blastopirellula marina]
MTIYENATEFYNLPVVDLESEDDWQGTECAYRIRTDWDTPPEELGYRLQVIANHEDAAELKALVIGSWGGDDGQTDNSQIIQELAECSDRLSGLKAIFLGDIISEENEMSWIQQSDVADVLRAYGNLELFRVRGGSGLGISSCEHENLKSLIIETGGMPRSVLREIFRGGLNNLEHLELWLGDENYGWNGGPEDLQPLLTGKLFPKLTYLGLRNSAAIDEIAPVLPNSPLVARLKVLDLSLGAMTEVGARSLLALSEGTSLEKLDLSYHYITPAVVEELKAKLPFEVVADDANDPNEEWRSIYVAE